MELRGKKFVVIYLTDWQKRMVKDFLQKDCNAWKVPVGDPVVKYGVRPTPQGRVKRMYLTDWQMREIRDEAGVGCDYIELEKEIVHTLYGVPPVEDC